MLRILTMDIESYIKHIRNTTVNSVNIFTKGKCFLFSLMLEQQFPGGKIYGDLVKSHFYYMYKGMLYDINGAHRPVGKKLAPVGDKEIRKNDVITQFSREHMTMVGHINPVRLY